MFKSMIDKWGKFVVQRRWLMIILTAMVMLVVTYPMKNLYFDHSSDMWFLPDDPALKDYQQLRERFGDSQYLSIGVEARPVDGTVFNRGTLGVIAKITEFLQDHELVTKVSSLTTYQYMHAQENMLETDDLIEDIEALPSTDEAMRELSSIMNKEKLAHGLMITEDFKHTVIVARTLYQKGTVDHHVKLINDLKAFFENENFAGRGYNLHLFGRALISERFFSLSTRDQGVWGSITYLLIVLTLGLSFRSLSGVFLPLLVAGSAIIMSMGLQGWLQWPFNLLNTALPLVLVVIGIGDSIHIMMGFYQYRHAGRHPREAAQMAVQSRWMPCFYTSLTTIVGFLAISVTQLAPLREYAVVAGFGCAIAFLVSVTTLPAILSFINFKPAKARRIVEKGWIARLTRYLPAFTLSHRKTLVIIGAVIAVAGISLSLQLSTDANFVKMFKNDTPIRTDFSYFDQTYGGGQNLEFMLDAGAPGNVKEPAFLRQALKLQTYLESLNITGTANSMLNYIRKMNQSMHGEDPAYYTIPATRNLIAQYLLLYENSNPDEDLSDLKSPDERFMRISIRTKNMSTGLTTDLVNQIQAELARTYPGLQVVITGDLMLFNKMDSYIAQGLVKSFSAAAAVILICFILIFRSFKYGMLALVPSLAPIICAGAVMYLLGIALDIGSVIIATVTLGIAVDDTVHLMNRYLKARREQKNILEAIQVAVSEAGRAIVYTSLILICGFSVMLLGSIMTSVYFGLFAVIIILLALVGDLVFLPSLLLGVDRKAAAETTDSQSNQLPQARPMADSQPCRRSLS